MNALAEIESSLAGIMRAGEAPESDRAEALLARHRAWVSSMWSRDCSPSAYAGLSAMYLSHEDFRTRFEAIVSGFTDWLAAAMRAHARSHGCS